MSSDDEPVKVTGNEDNPVAMEGYLEKRGKMKLVSTWKKYWFVLKGQLLLYYKTHLECDNLSVCRGSLNMGLASCVRPGAHRGPPANANQGYTIEVVTRTQVVTLRTKDRSLQEQWLKALLDSMTVPISTPIRNSTGPMHFRYSLDNLPVIQEAETDVTIRDKQSTLPSRNTVNRRESILGRIRKIGGTSYGGSLETVLKRRPSNKQSTQQQSPLQPKIPRIKAVDRMLGLQQNDDNDEEVTSENEDLSNHKESSTPKVNSFCKTVVNGSEDLNGSAHSSTDKDSSFREERLSDISADVSTLSTSQEVNEVHDRSEESKEKNKIISTSKSIENQNHENAEVIKLQAIGDNSRTFVKIEKQTIYIESKDDIVIDNKLYEKRLGTEKGDKTSDSMSDTEENARSVLNSLYIKSKAGEKSDEECDSEEELCKYKQNGGAKMYDEIKVDGTEVQEAKSQNNVNEENEEYYSQYDKSSMLKSLESRKIENNEDDEEEYYSQYDKFSLLKSMSNQEQEPVLPPRPSVSSRESNELTKSQESNKKEIENKESEDAEYGSYCETGANVTSSSLQMTSSGGEGSPAQKKKFKLQNKIKLRKKKSPSKESVASEEGNNNKSTKTKRKMSFLRRMIKNYKKKSGTHSDNAVDSDEPEYETVSYNSAVKRENVEKQNSSPPSVNDTPPSINNRPPSLVSENEHSEHDGHERISPEALRDKKPVPAPRPHKKNSDDIQKPDIPPKLPPRKITRPPSPWHDVPTNNSPIYGNFDDLYKPMEKKPEVPSKSSETEKYDQEIEDELLGTPRGFLYIQNKWKAVERSSEQNCKVKSPLQKTPIKNRTSDIGECKIKHTRSPSGGSVGKNSIKSNSSDSDRKSITGSNNEIYTDVNKLSAKTIIKSINSQNAQRDGSSRKNSEMCDSDPLKVSNSHEIKLDSVKSEENSDYQSIDGSVTDDSLVTLRRSFVDPSFMNSHDIHFSKTEINLQIHPSSQTFSEDYRNRPGVSEKLICNSSSYQLQPGTKETCSNGVKEEEYDIMPRLNRHSDELNLLLAQLAEITSAPLLPQTAATSLVDLPEGRKSKLQPQKTAQPSQPQQEQFVLGPIRRRRHSDPDYDVPRPHGSLIQMLANNRTSSRSSQSQSGQESDVVIEATHFFGEPDIMSSSGRSSLRHSVISEVDDQSEASYYVSMAPDSLEVAQGDT
ncbi:hypothetical protein C0J52_19691 [Blattella germanica]|nr:hypothetical protein C0J52_19691 [Blattella germanica]